VNSDLYDAYINLSNDIQEALLEISLLDQRALGLVYAEFTLGRTLTEEEKVAIETVSNITDTQTEIATLEQLIGYYEIILNRELTEIEKEALAMYEFYGE
jgi:hypothetical protein